MGRGTTDDGARSGGGFAAFRNVVMKRNDHVAAVGPVLALADPDDLPRGWHSVAAELEGHPVSLRETSLCVIHF